MNLSPQQLRAHAAAAFLLLMLHLAAQLSAVIVVAACYVEFARPRTPIEASLHVGAAHTVIYGFTC
jgi:hypothetical protein